MRSGTATSRAAIGAAIRPQPLGFEIALVTADVAGAHAQALSAGAAELSAAHSQALRARPCIYVRCPDGAGGLCTPVASGNAEQA
jgi:hypothetical protein